MQHAVAEQLEANLRIAGVRVHHVTVFPAANLLHRHRHVEMEQGDKRRDALFIQLINNLIIKIDRVRVHFTDTVGDQARPANRGAKAVVVQLLQQLNVRFPVLIKRGGVLRSHAVVKTVRLAGKPVVPRGFTLSCPFRLESGACAAPPEVIGKCVFHDPSSLT